MVRVNVFSFNISGVNLISVGTFWDSSCNPSICCSISCTHAPIAGTKTAFPANKDIRFFFVVIEINALARNPVLRTTHDQMCSITLTVCSLILFEALTNLAPGSVFELTVDKLSKKGSPASICNRIPGLLYSEIVTVSG